MVAEWWLMLRMPTWLTYLSRAITSLRRVQCPVVLGWSLSCSAVPHACIIGQGWKEKPADGREAAPAKTKRMLPNLDLTSRLAGSSHFNKLHECHTIHITADKHFFLRNEAHNGQ